MYTLTRTLTTPCTARQIRVLFPIYSRILRSLVSPITVFTNLVILADNLWNVALSRHFSVILLQPPKSGSKARWQNCPSYNICLIGRNKKKEREENSPSLHLPCCSSSTYGDCHYMPKITSHRLFFGRTGSTEICRSMFIVVLLCTQYVGNSVKE